MVLKKITFPRFILYVIILAMATCPAFAIKDDRPALLDTLMMFFPLILLFNLSYYKYEALLALFIITIFLFPPLFNSENLRWSTIFYSSLYCMAFMSYRRVFNKSGFTIEQYCRLLKLIIYAYFVVLLIQQFCVLVGLPVFLINAYNPTNPWKLNSLAMEPSHTARFVPLLMYSYITIKEIGVKKKYNLKSDFNKDKYIWIAFFWTMITMGSGTAFLFIPIVLLKFLRGRNIVYMALLAILLFFIAYQILPDTIKRTNDTFFATLTLEENKIIEADGSAAYRIVPMMIVAKNVELTKLKGWFGHGIDSSEQLLTETGRLLAAPDKLVGGGMFQLWYEYGFISFVLFVVFSALMCWRKGDWLSVVFWFFLVFMYGINNQMVWITIILLYTNKRFAKLQLKQ